MATRVRVMIVEDSPVVRQLLAHIIGRDSRFTVAAAVASGEEALSELGRVRPDVISMDIRLPGIDGLETTRRIMGEHPTPVVVVADAVEDASLKISMNALRAGALSVVEKPVGLGSGDYERVAQDICTQLFIMSSVPVIRRREIGGRPAASPPLPIHAARPFAGLGYLALAASTGGPPALARVLDALPADFPAPVFIVQHMGPAFMEGFAQWLDGLSRLKVGLAVEGEVARAGQAYVAPGDHHLTVAAGGVMRLNREPAFAGQRPSANVLLRSLAKSAGAQTVGVILTGMGEDGAQGLLELRMAGGHTIVEHPSTTVVNGMPGAAARLGGAREILPLDRIGGRILDLAASGAAGWTPGR
ncbi:chemotaxis-specific protein-glutamate methyltransferase CheB [Phenylobacterium immobile]|uniref:chemotaxis-specific protein-glutamate methyltransferase CheB n=1 Tax=Phenylobacterium immobile TaxID=21 RepID=UPI000A53F425|nr:chemotaxis-specific protein-glutamate methyltransferase CheB [Phenylobacterium immobile]